MSWYDKESLETVIDLKKDAIIKFSLVELPEKNYDLFLRAEGKYKKMVCRFEAEVRDPTNLILERNHAIKVMQKEFERTD